MRKHPTSLLAGVAGLSVVLAACGGGSPSPSTTASTAESMAASTAESMAASMAESMAPHSDLKIGVVTDVGTVNDKNFNEYTYVGAKEARPRSAPPSRR